MSQQQVYPIGKVGQKWGESEKAQWFAMQQIKRSYADEVLAKTNVLHRDFDVEQYGALSINAEKYPLIVVKSKNFSATKPTILVTGGVHGYETSGVQGALRFLSSQAVKYSKYFNIIVAPCISPWGYETINRWNPKAIDPNRSFYENSPAEESASIMAYVNRIKSQQNISILLHIDLHETTDTDNTEFRPALAARDAETHDNWSIPDGFYLVGDTKNPQPEFQKTIIDAVANITHIAPADENGKLIGVDIEQFGVINYATKKLGLCAGFSDAAYCTTTEVYPDSPKVDDENCILAQVTAITSALDYVLVNENIAS
jgi:hypothetical protein